MYVITDCTRDEYEDRQCNVKKVNQNMRTKNENL